jgi:hypothetical protein
VGKGKKWTKELKLIVKKGYNWGGGDKKCLKSFMDNPLGSAFKKMQMMVKQKKIHVFKSSRVEMMPWVS